jgi:hypothetical protein
LPSPETTVSWTGRPAGAAIVGGLSVPPGRIVNVAGTRASAGGVLVTVGEDLVDVVLAVVVAVAAVLAVVVAVAAGALAVAVVADVVAVAGAGAGVVVARVLVDAPQPASATAERAPRTTAAHLTFAG